MFGTLLLIIVCVAFLLGGIQLCALLGLFIGSLFGEGTIGGGIGTVTGYFIGIVLWAGALVLGIFQVIALVQQLTS